MSEKSRCFRLINPPPEHTHITDPATGEPVENPRAGEPQPFLGVGRSYAVPTMVGGELIPVAQTAYVGVPGFLKAHRQALPSQLLPVDVSEDGQVITATGVAAQLLAEHDLFEECDPPKRVTAKAAKAETTISKEG